MSPDRDVEHDDATGLTYPSPGAEAMDAGPFYHANARDAAAPEHSEHQPDHPVTKEDRASGHEDPLSPQQHSSRPPNLEELQLAAQLGDGLAGGPILSTTDPNMNVDEQTTRNIMPNPDQQHQGVSAYGHEPANHNDIVQQAMQASVGASLPVQYHLDDGIPPRKRSKVSRACDECRRKKIKCDAQIDTGEAPCSSCARSSIRCLFSRVPQKRGPSKGYIKELADRIHSIENKLESEGNLTQDDLDKLFAPERPRSHSHAVPAEEVTRKRPYANIASGDYASPVSSRQVAWGSEPRPGLPASSSETLSNKGYSNNNALAPQPSAIKADTSPSKSPTAVMDAPVAEVEESVELDEAAYEHYLATCQPLYPILPKTASRVQALLSQSPAPLRAAFPLALLSVGPDAPEDVAKQADTLLHDWEGCDSPRSRVVEIVHAQTLLLLVIHADLRAAPALPFLLARAIALANSMKLWKTAPVEAQEEDSDHQLCVRIWWSLVMLDRWYAAGAGRPSQIPDSSVVAGAGLLATVGEVCFHFIRLCKLLNRIAFVISTMPVGATTAEQTLVSVLDDYIENYREDLPPHVYAAFYPLVHLGYWHCRLLVTMLKPDATASETIWPTKEIIHLLHANPTLKTPLLHHFTSLLALALGKLVHTESTREEALQLVKDLAADSPPSEPLAGSWESTREKLVDQLRPGSSAEATASQGLQHLADLATAHEGIVPGEGEVSFGALLASGYLEAS